MTFRSHGVSGESQVEQPLTGGTAQEDGDLQPEPRPAEEDNSYLKAFALKVCCSIGIFVILTLLLERFAEDKVTYLSEQLMTSIGLPGLFLCVFMADGVPQPFTYVPLIFMAVKGSVPKPVVLATCAAASYSAGIIGYLVGAGIRAQGVRSLEEFLKRSTAPAVMDIMVRRGAWGVLLAAVLPMPLAIATWTAGYLRVAFLHFLPAPLGRLPKIMLFILLSPPPQPASQPFEDTIVDE